jgi:hypothetical protein
MFGNLNISVSIILVILIIYIYQIQYHQIVCDQVFIDELISSNVLKTGDIILFKGANSFNAVFIGNYFTHCGVVYIDPDDETRTPMIFEANGIENTPLKPHHNKLGMYLTPLADRAKKYKGRVFLKALNKDIPEETIRAYKDFIQYAIENMRYDRSVLSSGLRKGLGLEKCTLSTNCGEIAFLSIIKLRLIHLNKYDNSMFHHLKWVCNIEKLENGYEYLPLIEIVDHPFAE